MIPMEVGDENVHLTPGDAQLLQRAVERSERLRLVAAAIDDKGAAAVVNAIGLEDIRIRGPYRLRHGQIQPIQIRGQLFDSRAV